MNYKHWIGVVIVLLVGYALGVKFPQYASNIPGLGS